MLILFVLYTHLKQVVAEVGM